MEKKDIYILVFVLFALALNFYLRKIRKKKAAADSGTGTPEKKGGITGPPDDYEPYSNRK
jgi:hypothetical protein